MKKTPKIKTTFRRSSKSDCHIRSGSKSEALDEEPTDGSSTVNIGQPKKVKEKAKRKVNIQTDRDSSDDSEPETYSCQYCLTGNHESVIECEKRSRS